MTDHPQEHPNLSNYSNVPPDCECAEFRAEGKRGIVTLYFEDGNRAIEWLNTPPHEHESLSAFIEKVEASGEDRKHEALGYIDDDDLEEMQHRPWHVCNPRVWEERLKDTTAIYTQQQLDDAVRAERERSAADTKRLQTLVDNLEDDGYGFWLSEWCVKEGDVRPTLDELRAFLDNPNEEQEP